MNSESSMIPKRLAREVVYQSMWVNLYKDTVEFPNGFVIDKFHLLDFEREAVAAVMENEAGEVVFVRIPRYTTGTAEWELPAGGMEPGEPILEAAKRELIEETGCTSTDHELIYTYYPMNGQANQTAGSLQGSWGGMESRRGTEVRAGGRSCRPRRPVPAAGLAPRPTAGSLAVLGRDAIPPRHGGGLAVAAYACGVRTSRPPI